MKSLYVVLYLFNQAVYSVGPWPAGSDDSCHATAMELQDRARDHRWEWAEESGKPVGPFDLNAVCAYYDKSPVNP